MRKQISKIVQRIQPDESGVLLLLALVMTLVILSAALVIATLAIRESRLSQVSDQGRIASYAAESAAELAGYEIFKNGSDPAALDGLSGSLGNGSAWTLSVQTTTSQFVFDYIPSGGSEFIDLYNRQNENATAGASALNFSWSSGSAITIEYAEWDGGFLTTPTSRILACNSSPCTGSLPLNPIRAYAMEVIASGSSVTDLFVDVVPTGTAVEIPTRIVSTGEYRTAKQSLELVLDEAAPWEESSGTSAPATTCGNGSIEQGEQCDDGNTADGDGCSSACFFEGAFSVCGDGILEGIEQCDDGDNINGDGCSAGCLLEGPTCGDGAREGGEECDDGNTANGDGCSSVCIIEAPTNDVPTVNVTLTGCTATGITPSENCQFEATITDSDTDNWILRAYANGSATPFHTSTSTSKTRTFGTLFSGCPGDPETHAIQVEVDDEQGGTGSGGTTFDVFNRSGNACPQASGTCGNGATESGEQCDDGNTTNGDGCSATCQAEAAAVCGNGTDETGEACDDGDAADTGTCNASCSALTFCGDATMQNPNGDGETEQCDDGNVSAGDGCDVSCQIEPICGNSTVEAGETCDDGDVTNLGTCNASCSALTSCGDGTTQDPNGQGAAEACDDGNTANGDGCSATCEVEAPTICGDGIINGSEVCDDSNATEAGRCNASCSALTFCGDSTIQTPNGQSQNEQCDDGNTADGDGCSSTCQDEVALSCGNGTQEGAEECDDGNNDDGDYCTFDCKIPLCIPVDAQGRFLTEGTWQSQVSCDSHYVPPWPYSGCYEYSYSRPYPSYGGYVYDKAPNVIEPFIAACANRNGSNCATYFRTNNASDITFNFGPTSYQVYRSSFYGSQTPTPSVSWSSGIISFCR